MHFCEGCGTEYKAVESAPPRRIPRSKPEYIEPRGSSLLSAGFFRGAEPLDLTPIDMGYSVVEGFSHPDWKVVRLGIRKSFPKELWPQAWREVGIRWLVQLQEDLGGSYQQYESWNFLLLSAETKEDSEAMLEIAENAV